MLGKGIAELEKENVLIRAGACTVTLLPQFGGKIASIRLRDRELLQRPLAAIAPRTPTMPFDAADASGWDECLPSVAGCTIMTDAGPAEVPDHGDLWRVSWQTVESNGVIATQRARCFSLPLTLERTIRLSDIRNGWRLSLEYNLTNSGTHSVPWSWSAHPLFAAEPGDSIELPASIHSLRVEGSAANRLGTSGSIVGWPIAQLSEGPADLSVAYPPDSAFGDKLFAGPLAPDANWCVLKRPGAGVRIRVSFDTAATPYLGLWLCYGGWPGGPGPKQNCVALEPATAPVDSLAITGPWSRTLAPGQSYSWPMTVALESL